MASLLQSTHNILYLGFHALVVRPHCLPVRSQVQVVELMMSILLLQLNVVGVPYFSVTPYFSLYQWHLLLSLRDICAM